MNNEKKDYDIEDYNFTFLYILSEHMEIDIYYDYLRYQDKYLLKNNWNHLICKLKEINKYTDKKKINNISSREYNYIHKIINPDELNNLFNEFISEDKFKALIVLLSLSDCF